MTTLTATQASTDSPNINSELQQNVNYTSANEKLAAPQTSDSSSSTPTTKLTDAKPKKNKPSRVERMASKLSCKNPFVMFLCLPSEDKNKSTEKEAAPVSIKPVIPEPEIIVSEKEAPEDLIYSASPDGAPQPSSTLIVAPETPEKRLSTSSRKYLLDPIEPQFKGKMCLVLDLDETLVHSSFKLIDHPDFIVPVEIDNQLHNVYVAKRPGVDEFLLKVGEVFEVVIFTASLSKYADPVLDMLDRHKVIQHRLFRESCYNHNGNYVKDLSQIGRPLSQTIIIDNSPTSYIFHPANAVPITTWFNDLHDTELLDLIPFLKDLSLVDDVTQVLDNNNNDPGL